MCAGVGGADPARRDLSDVHGKKCTVCHETDEDAAWIVGELIPNESPPIAVCRHMLFVNMNPRNEDDEVGCRYEKYHIS